MIGTGFGNSSSSYLMFDSNLTWLLKTRPETKSLPPNLEMKELTLLQTLVHLLPLIEPETSKLNITAKFFTVTDTYLVISGYTTTAVTEPLVTRVTLYFS